ncbi:hypothetical protein INS49_007552 [Diaporthe citri]|uniref:uncharacterized protein n=1 Tax=Diaporthe citri TaxID=83186 RepID=UPI001C7E48DD|nr:uncharacterized protein INS49_007552 [Diaporthe citri]KAG6353311.1 hypothetical protein INS49_007552 [Diaporthe citri]
MRSLVFLTAGVSILRHATASFAGNLNYHSPSRLGEHVNFAIHVDHISRRSLKRGNIAYGSSELSFTHGISSGDPYPDSVILWTRIAPSTESDQSNVTVEGTVPVYNHDTETYIEADANPICVEWAVWRQTYENGTHSNGTYAGPAESSGTAYTTSDIDFTVKADYQFTVCDSDNSSPIGRTKTSPASDADVDEVKLAVFSCSNYPNGYFNAYGNAARKDGQDYVVHVGDYIYEGAAGGSRGHQPPRLLFSLFDYRTRHGQYRSDPDLQLLAQNHAWITTWDDHEVANNGYRDGFSALNNTEESFRNHGPSISVDQRRMNTVDLDNNLRIWRSFQMGNLLDLIVIDTRNYDRSTTDLGWNSEYIQLLRNDASRSLMGSHQENWFYNQLTNSNKRGATYRVVANQIVFSRILENNEPDGDNWEGYVANRNRTLRHLYDNSISNTIFLAGDSHQNWVSDLAWLETKPYNAADGDGAIGVEFAGTAVSSTGNRGLILDTQADAQVVVEENESLQWQDGYYRGYFILSLTPERATAQYFGSPSVATRNSWDLSLANFTKEAGSNRLTRPVAGGTVEAGFLRGGETVHTNLTLNTETGEYEVIGFETMHLTT